MYTYVLPSFPFTSPYKMMVHVVVVVGFNVAFNNFSVTAVCKLDRELSAYFYGGVSLKYLAPSSDMVLHLVTLSCPSSSPSVKSTNRLDCRGR